MAEQGSTSSQLDLVLFSPRIPHNVGAVGRLCAATRTPLHVIRPITFPLDDKSLLRSGLDYWQYVDVTLHRDFEACREALGEKRWFLFSTHGTVPYEEAGFGPGDVLLFGNESHGAPDWVHEAVGRERILKIPIFEPNARSLNLSMSAAIGLYEAIRQVRHGG